ncbi:MAG: hypothetical protein VW378_05290 [bacterium]
MTHFLQQIINDCCPIKACITHQQWLEIDSHQDLKAYEGSDYFDDWLSRRKNVSNKK